MRLLLNNEMSMSKKNSERKVTKALDWNQECRDFSDFIKDFKYQPRLTRKLDAARQCFSQSLINEIVLWKVNRYVEVPEDVLESLDSIRSLRPGEYRKAELQLKSLLACKGVRLPMASTILRFANPNVFQIYDRHICRAMTGECEMVPPKQPEEAVEKYWVFLDNLEDLCEKLKISFKDADRILFCFDKAENPPLSETQS